MITVRIQKLDIAKQPTRFAYKTKQSSDQSPTQLIFIGQVPENDFTFSQVPGKSYRKMIPNTKARLNR